MGFFINTIKEDLLTNIEGLEKYANIQKALEGLLSILQIFCLNSEEDHVFYEMGIENINKLNDSLIDLILDEKGLELIRKYLQVKRVKLE